METTEIILNALKKAGKPMKVAELADQTGLDKKEADKAIKKLKAENKIISPKVCFYQAK
jgi:DNA-binding Lrp family transcriptional regulator